VHDFSKNRIDKLSKFMKSVSIDESLKTIVMEPKQAAENNEK